VLADEAGIALTFLPTLYQTGTSGCALKREQMRFALETEGFLQAVEARLGEDARRGSRLHRTGAAFHSLRAVPLAVLAQAARSLRDMAADLPLHIHVAEQTKEVEACIAHTGRRPIDLLLGTGLLDRHWCLVHATHATASELEGMSAAALRSACRSPLKRTWETAISTRPIPEVRRARVRGFRQQATVSPAEELRWMEYQAGCASAAAQCSPIGKMLTSVRGSGAKRRAREHDRSVSPGCHRNRGARRLGGARRRPSEHGRTDDRAHWTILFSGPAAPQSATSWWAGAGSSRTAGMRLRALWPHRFGRSCGNDCALTPLLRYRFGLTVPVYTA